MQAQTVAWSSIVGTGVLILDDKGVCIGQLSLHNVKMSAKDTKEDLRIRSLDLANQVTTALNNQWRKK